MFVNYCLPEAGSGTAVVTGGSTKGVIEEQQQNKNKQTTT